MTSLWHTASFRPPDDQFHGIPAPEREIIAVGIGHQHFSDGLLRIPDAVSAEYAGLPGYDVLERHLPGNIVLEDFPRIVQAEGIEIGLQQAVPAAFVRVVLSERFPHAGDEVVPAILDPHYVDAPSAGISVGAEYAFRRACPRAQGHDRRIILPPRIEEHEIPEPQVDASSGNLIRKEGEHLFGCIDAGEGTGPL